MNFYPPLKLVKKRAGTHAIIKGEYTTLEKQASTKTDLTFQEIIEGKELAIIAALKSHNLVYTDKRKLFKVNKDQSSFNIKGFFAVLTSNFNYNIEAPVIFEVTPPTFHVVVDNEVIHSEDFITDDFNEGNFLKTVNATVKYATPFKVGDDSQLKQNDFVHFLGNITLKTLDGYKRPFAAGEVRKISSVNGQIIEISGYRFTKKEFEKAEYKQC